MKKIELKAKQFAKVYIRNKFNGTKTALEVYDPKNKEVANAIASENLRKPLFQKAIEEELSEQGLTDEIVVKEQKKVIIQDKHLPSKNVAIDMYHKIRGNYAPEKKITMNLKYRDIQEVRTRITDLQNELKQLREGAETA